MTTSPIQFAVVIPVYNRPEYLFSSIDSVCQQTYRPAQVIVVDDCSHEKYKAEFSDIISRFQDRLTISYVRLSSNVGPASARNRAVEYLIPSVTHISYLDSDDVWHPCKLEVIANAYARLGCDIVLHEYTYSREQFDSIRCRGLGGPLGIEKKITSLDAIISNPCQTSCLTIPVSSVIPFRSGQRYCEDYCLILSALSLKSLIYKISCPLTLLGREQHSAGGLSVDILQMRIGEIMSYWHYSWRARLQYLFPLLLLWSFFKALILFVRLLIKRVSRSFS